MSGILFLLDLLIWLLLILGVNHQNSSDILHSCNVCTIVKNKTVEIGKVEEFLLELQAYPHGELVVQIFKGQALIVKDYYTDGLEDVGDEFLVHFVDLLSHLVDGL